MRDKRKERRRKNTIYAHLALPDGVGALDE
jgi:hypothetical protein